MKNFSFKGIESAGNLSGKKVLVRVDFNVPIKNGQVTDDFRIRKTLPTIEHLKDEGAKIILLSHMSGNELNSLKPVPDAFPSHLKPRFVETFFDENADATINNMKDGDVVLFENLRLNSGEKEAEEMFARNLSSMGQVFINDAFAVSHRRHSSIVLIPKFLPSFAGFLFQEEVSNLSKALNPPHPFLFILGGAKFETKIPIAKKFVGTADRVVVAGAISNEFFESQGLEVGRSLTSNLSHEVPEGVFLPVDVRVTNEKKTRITEPKKIKRNERIVDIGPKTLKLISKLADDAKLILWNGPVGEYKEGYKETSLEVARIIAESQAESITGGGDTLSAISEIKVEEKFTFVSTAGGAMLEFLAKGTLPGIEALEEPRNKLSK